MELSVGGIHGNVEYKNIQNSNVETITKAFLAKIILV